MWACFVVGAQFLSSSIAEFQGPRYRQQNMRWHISGPTFRYTCNHVCQHEIIWESQQVNKWFSEERETWEEGQTWYFRVCSHLNHFNKGNYSLGAIISGLSKLIIYLAANACLSLKWMISWTQSLKKLSEAFSAVTYNSTCIKASRFSLQETLLGLKRHSLMRSTSNQSYTPGNQKKSPGETIITYLPQGLYQRPASLSIWGRGMQECVFWLARVRVVYFEVHPGFFFVGGWFSFGGLRW